MKLGLTILLPMLLVACASKPAPQPEVATTTGAVTAPAASTPATNDCEIVCSDVEVVAETPRVEQSDYHAAAVTDARGVIASIHDDLMTCYRQRLATHPRAHGSPTFDIVIDENGTVRKIDTTGGGPLGDATMKCMTSRMMRAHFAPVRGGGTLRIHVPLLLRHGGSPDRDDAI